MNILVIGGTRFFGIPMIEELLKSGHDVTIATRGLSADSFGSRVKRLILDRTDAQSVRNALSGRHFDVIIDKLAYCSNDIKSAMDVAGFDRYIQMSTTAVYDPKHINTMESDFDALAKELVWCGRAVTLLINGRSVNAPEMRLALGSTKMRSTLFTDIQVSDDRVVFSGKGYGHGVGMPQWGAYGMAEEGKTAEEIVSYYFDGVTVEKVW